MPSSRLSKVGAGGAGGAGGVGGVGGAWYVGACGVVLAPVGVAWASGG